MKILFECMSMILKNHMFKIDLSRFLKFVSITLLINCHLKFTYALSTSKVIIIIYQSSNVKIFLNTIPPISKYFWHNSNTLKFSKLCIQHTINSILCTMMVWQWLKRFLFYFFAFMCKNMIELLIATFVVYLIMFYPILIYNKKTFQQIPH